MRKHEFDTTHDDFYEYFGNVEIIRIRKQRGQTVREDWMIFDSVAEAMEYFNAKCGEHVGYYN